MNDRHDEEWSRMHEATREREKRILDLIRGEQMRLRWRHKDRRDGMDGHTGSVGADLVRISSLVAPRRRQLTWAAILMEEVGEVLQADDAELDAELVQVAAVCLAWLEARDRRRAAGGEP